LGRREERRKKREAESRKGKMGLLLLGLRLASAMAGAVLAARGGKVVVCLFGGRLPMCERLNCGGVVCGHENGSHERRSMWQNASRCLPLPARGK